MSGQWIPRRLRLEWSLRVTTVYSALLISSLLSPSSSSSSSSPAASSHACTVCTGSTYQHRPCHGKFDSVCIQVVQPLVAGITKSGSFLEENVHKQMAVTRKKKKVRTDSSENVFLENLHSAKNLVTVYYVTNINQLTDFVWFRDSGIRVNVGLQNINLMPVYGDVDHAGDNSFMLQNPNSDQEAKHFSEILNKHCRNPLPDYYNVTLEIYRDRTTKASAKECSPSHHNFRNCHFESGMNSYFLHRSVNEPCPIKSSHLETMKPAANSIICTDGNDLLHDLFKLAASEVHPIRSSTASCSESFLKCRQCLEISHCPLVNDDDQLCCHGDCLHSPECKQHFSTKCRRSPVECATGDAFRYTLTPVYLHLENQFRCHIRRKPPDILYRLWFYLTIPVNGSIVETPKKSSEILYSDVEDFVRGTKDIEFLTVEHRAGYPLGEELILIGNDLSEGGLNYTVEYQTHHHHTSNIRPEWIQSNVFTFSTQFEDPFTYSTSTWVNNHNYCNKDVRVFRPVPRDIREESVNVMARAHGSSFQYTVMSLESDPHLRFSLPGNVSILSWWFRDNPSTIVFDRTLETNLTLSDDHKTWTIHISGKLRRCPGYFKITVNDHSDQEEVAQYDAFLSCPVNFNISFQFPNYGIKKEKTYELIINDLSTEHSIFLTKLGQRGGDQESDLKQNLNERELFDESTIRENYWGSSRTLIIIIFVLIFVLFCVLMDLLCSASFIISCWHNDEKYRLSQPSLSFARAAVGCSVVTEDSYKAIFCPYFLMRLLYSVLFTCTTISLLLGFIQWDQLRLLRQFTTADDTPSLKEIPDIAMSRVLQVNDIGRQQMVKKFSIQRACNSYLDGIFANLTAALHDTQLKHEHHDFSSDGNSITALFQGFAKGKQEHLCNKTKAMFQPVLQMLSQNVHLVINYFFSQLTVSFGNLWFSQARSLSKKPSRLALSNPMFDDDHNRRSNHFEGLSELARLLEISEFEEIKMFKATFSRQLEVIFEKALSPLNRSTSFILFPCHRQSSSFADRSTELQRINSTRYFASKRDLLEPNSNDLAARNASSWDDDDLIFYQTLSLKLLHLMLFVDTFLLIYRVTNLCLEITRTLHRQRVIDFVRNAHESPPPESQVVKKKEKCVSFADLDRCSSDLTKSFHSMQDLYRKPSVCNTAVNVCELVQNNCRRNSSFAIPLKQFQTIQGNLRPRMSHMLITLNSLSILYQSVDYLADRHPLKNLHFACMHCIAYAQFFLKLVRRSDAVPRAVLAGVLFLLCGLVLNVIGQNVVPQFLVSFLDLCACNLNFKGHLQDLTDGSNEELALWKSRFMTFEVKQLQGILEFFDTGHKARLKNYQNHICTLRKQLGLSSAAACIQTPTKSILTQILPCNFIRLEPIFHQEEELNSLKQNISSRLVQELSTVSSLVMSVCVALCLFVITSFVFQVAMSAFYVSKLQHLIPVRTFITTDDCNFVHSMNPGNMKGTKVCNSKMELLGCEEPRPRPKTGSIDHYTTVSCSLVNVSSVSSSTNIYAAANLKKFSETKV